MDELRVRAFAASALPPHRRSPCTSHAAEGPLKLILPSPPRCHADRYDLFRVDPRTGANVPVCKIVRQWTLFNITDHYVIQHFGNVGLNGPIACTGSWLNQFTLTAGGVLAARVDKKFFSLTDTYKVCVGAGMDVLLFVGIACAIDRIHHEVEDARERNRPR